MENFADEINLMNKHLSGEVDQVTEPPSTELPSTEAPSTELPSTELPSTDAPSTDAPSTDEPSTDQPLTEAPSTEAPDDLITSLKAEIEELKSLVKGRKPTTEAPSTEAPLNLEEQNFLEGIDIDELTEDSAKLNKLLNKIYQQAVTDTRKILGESVLRSIPDIVKTNIATVTNLQKASEQFYDQNPDLKPFKKVVAAVFEELASQHSDKRYDEVLAKVGDEVRKRLDLHKKASKTTKKSAPRLPGKRSSAGRPKEQPKTDSLLSELEEMNKVLGR